MNVRWLFCVIELFCIYVELLRMVLIKHKEQEHFLTIVWNKYGTYVRVQGNINKHGKMQSTRLQSCKYKLSPRQRE